MVPLPSLPAEDPADERVFAVEKLGLDVAQMNGAQENDDERHLGENEI